MERHSMDHELAVKSQACEKYLLGELSPELRDEFEEHYFACSECAAQLTVAAEFVGASSKVLATAPSGEQRAAYVRVPRGWFSWLQPVIAVPAFAVLLLIIGFQNLVTIPHWKHAGETRVLPMFSLISANTRSERGLVFTAAPDEPFGVYVDVPADPAYVSYLLRLEDPSGRTALLRTLTAEEAQKTQVVTVNPGKRAGKFTIVVSGLTTAAVDAATAKELARLQFTVELKK